jgi:hypothetical protein
MAFGQDLGLSEAALLLRGFLTGVVPGSRRAVHELAPGGHFETFRNGLLGLLHDNDSGERSGSEQETPPALARGKWAAAQNEIRWGKPGALPANQPRIARPQRNDPREFS